VFGKAWVSGDARVFGDADLLVIGPMGSRRAFTTFTANQVACGCFTGSFKEFKKRVIKTHGDNQHGREYLAALVLAELRFSKKGKP